MDLVGKTSNNEILNIVLRKQRDSLIEESKMQKRNNNVLRKQIVDSSEETNMYRRSLYYWSKLYSAQLQESQKYQELNPVITINILDFNLFKDKRCHRDFILKDEDTNEEYLRMIEMHFVELNKRKYMDQNDKLWAWTEFLKAPNSENLKYRKEELEEIFDAKEIFDGAIADPVQKEQMRLLEKKQFDDLSSLAKAHDDGVAKGEKKGLKKRREEGLKEGKISEQREIALNMKNQGLDNNFIAKCLNISIDKLNKLFE